MIVTLPYPDKVLNPNARAHWAAIARAKKMARHTAAWLVIDAIGSRSKLAPYAELESLPMAIRFYPADNRRRDMDNALASLKAALDGISDALGMDDSRFLIMPQMMASDGKARVEIVL